MKRFSFGVAAALTLAAAPAFAQGSGAQARPDSGRRTLEREVFTYQGGGRRDPMLSLVMSGDIRPLLTEVELVAIIYDEGGSNHMALLRNIGSSKDKGKQYRIKVGQMLGRMRVAQINRKEVVFTLDEFGFSRQQRLSVKPDTTARTP
jgi:hypothetical protein